MDFEERERQKKRQFIKVLIAEIGMVIAVVAIVVISTLASMGFFVTSDGKVEQLGIMQIHSIPTGATVELDGNVLFSRTNLSRSLMAGEHDLRLQRGGYDEWAKKVKVYSGLLARLYYPRIFLMDRVAEKALTLGEKISFYSVSDDYTGALYAEEKSTTWNFLNIKGDEVRRTSLELAEILPGVVEVADSSRHRTQKREFTGKVEEIRWSKENDFVLLKVFSGENREWILINVKNSGESFNLTKIFGLNFEKVEMIDGSASQLFALENGHLRKIKTSDQSISRVLLDGLLDFMSVGTDVIYSAEQKREMDGEMRREKVVGVYRDSEKAGTVIARAEEDTKLKVGLSEYYGEKYMVFIMNNLMTIYYGAIPAYRENNNDTDFSGMKVLVKDLELAKVPESLAVSAEGEYFWARSGRQVMMVDVDMGDLYEYEIEDGMSVGWLNEAMLYGVKGGNLEVWDFDNTNRRVLVKKTSVRYSTGSLAAAGYVKTRKTVTTMSRELVLPYPVMISSDNKWLYYIVQVENGQTELRREKVRD